MKSAAVDLLPIREVVEPTDHDQVVEILRDCHSSATAVYPIGGGTSLNYGLPPRRPGIGLSLAKLNRVLDYPARDMTITIQAGLTAQSLVDTLATEKQRLPIDVPQPAAATWGGVVATNTNGPRRYGQGSVRDHVIGIRAVDGGGTPFRGGGRVVKNVAGYDFCKLLTGSLGTLAVITELTFKLKPIPPEMAIVIARLNDWDQAEQLLAALVHSQTTPAAIELLSGSAWQDDLRQRVERPLADRADVWLAVAFEGTDKEVEWLTACLQREWAELGVADQAVCCGDGARMWMEAWSQFPAGDAPLVLKFSVVPCHTTRVIAAARRIDPACSILAHAGNGIVIVRLSEFPAEGLARTVVGQLQPAAAAGLGRLVVLANPSGTESTHQSVWGGREVSSNLMKAVKQQFDPANILNPGRFIYP